MSIAVGTNTHNSYLSIPVPCKVLSQECSFFLADSEKSAANQGSENKDMILDESFPFFLLFCVWGGGGMGLQPDFESLPCPRVFALTIIVHTTISRTLLVERSARGRDLCLTKHNTHKRKTYMPLEGFEPTTRKRVATDPRLRSLGHWVRFFFLLSL